MPGLVIAAETRLKACPERAAGIDWPMPLDQRLDELCDLADEEGAETSRKELAAALVLAAPSSPVRLKALIDKYRKAKAREAAVTPNGEDRVLTIRPRQMGRRSRRVPATVQEVS
jgi:hypothetical protein